MTIRTLKIDSNGNPIITNGNFNAVLQICEQVMKTQLGEYQYNQTKGIDYFGNVFTGTPNFQRFEVQARTQLEAVNGVTRVESLNYRLSDNKLIYTATIATIYGTGTITNGDV
jgi:hypothetical protein